jgi:peptidoglycan/xylan/chitin deacetylase (PgdA/CDA1 family)
VTPREADPRELRVALTFDTEHPDRPARRGNDERLIEAVAGSGIRATFFLQGRWAEAWPDLARRIAADGHLIGSHSHYHARMTLFSDAGLAEDVRAAEAAIMEMAGVDPRPWFRCPFGDGTDDPHVLSGVEAPGYRHVGWHVAADDWDPLRSAAQVEESVVSGALRHGDGTVVLLHSWPNQTLEALQGIVGRLREAGATFVGIDELEELPRVPAWVDETSEEAVPTGSTGPAGSSQPPAS